MSVALLSTRTILEFGPVVRDSHFDLANPARRWSRLGVVDTKELFAHAHLISGVMFHFNCENDNFGHFSYSLDTIGRVYGKLLEKLEWVSLGGGLYFTKDGYPLDHFCKKLKEFAGRYGVDIRRQFAEALARGEQAGLLRWAGPRLQLTEGALPVADSVLVDFIA